VSNISIDDILMGARLLRDLPRFLRTPVTLEEARVTLRRRLENREADFLALAKRAIYAHSSSPYRSLLQLAGCEYGDLERLVGQHGVEGALTILLRHGVYLTVEEFKGRSSVRRGGTTLEMKPHLVGNPLAMPQVGASTSGSRHVQTPVRMDLAYIRDFAANNCLVEAVRGGPPSIHAVWAVPGGSALVGLLRYAAFGAVPARWFSQLDLAAPGLHSRYRWSARLLEWGGRVARVGLPRPEHVPVDESRPIAEWMAGVLGTGSIPDVFGFVSSAVRICQAAAGAGLDLRGARFTVGGEPLTPTRLALIRAAGASVEPFYGIMEAGPIGWGCFAPDAPDEMHAFHDLHALVEVPAEEKLPGLAAGVLLVTSLRATAPLVLLNVCFGDGAVLTRRPCGCPLQALGWTTHLHSVRSHEKLTAGGMTFLDADLVHVLEEVLPAQFGGRPTDYQAVEEEADDGRPVLRLLVHPHLGPLDMEALGDTFLSAIGQGSGTGRVMSLVWRDAGVLRVERRAPIPTASGKILHLHRSRAATTSM